MQHSACPAEEKTALWGCPNTLNEDQPAWLSTTPQYHRLPCVLLLCLTQTEPRPPISNPDSWPHIQQNGLAMALGHHLYPTLVFRHLSLDLISDACIWRNLMQKTELLLPHGRKPCCWEGCETLRERKPA